MADQLATASDLASLLQQDVDTSTANLVLELAMAVVQQACGGQRIVEVVADEISIGAYSDSWLDLPQIPVTAVASVTLDGVLLVAGTDYKVVGNRIFRRQGWQNNLGLPWDWPYPWPHASIPPGYPVQEPSTVDVVYTHGYPAGSQDLQLGRSAVLSLARGGYSNPSGANSESIDDYSATFDAMAGRMEAAQFLKTALNKKYGRRAGLVRIG